MPEATAVIAPGHPEVCMISIRSPGKSVTLQSGWKDILILTFDDITEPREPFIAFNEDHARAILHFVKNHGHSSFFIHCEAGLSRSAAVAAVLSELFQVKEISTLTGRRAEFPNGLIMRTFHKLFWDGDPLINEVLRVIRPMGNNRG